MRIADRLKYDGPDGVLVWKHPQEDLRIGSQLVVNQAQEAIFLKGGEVADVFGPGTHTLMTANLPLLDKIVNLPFDGKTPFTAEVFFVNRAAKLDMKWGTPDPIRLTDPVYDTKGHGSVQRRFSFWDDTLRYPLFRDPLLSLRCQGQYKCTG